MWAQLLYKIRQMLSSFKIFFDHSTFCYTECLVNMQHIFNKHVAHLLLRITPGFISNKHVDCTLHKVQ